MRLLPLLVLLTACIPPMEEHGGTAPLPQKVTDAEFAAMGATFDAGLQFAKIPMIPRLAIDGAAAVCVRTCKFAGRTVDSGFMFMIGTFPTTFVGFVGHAVNLRKHPDCLYAGGDGYLHRGHLYGEICR